MTNVDRSHSSDSGYSLIEMLFVLGLLALVSSMAIVQINVSKPGLKGDGAMRILLGQLNQARESAITQRRYVRVVFTAPEYRADSSAKTRPTTTTTLSSVLIEGGVQFAQVSGLPDTPEKSSAIAPRSRSARSTT